MSQGSGETTAAATTDDTAGESLRLCLAQLHGADRDLYAACLLLAPARRRPAAAFAALHAELTAVADRSADPLATRIRLQWWQDGIAAIAGEAMPESPIYRPPRTTDSPVLHAVAATAGDDAAIDDVAALVAAHIAAHDAATETAHETAHDTARDAALGGGAQPDATAEAEARATGGRLVALMAGAGRGDQEGQARSFRDACEEVGAAWAICAALRRRAQGRRDAGVRLPGVTDAATVRDLARRGEALLAAARARLGDLAPAQRRALLLALPATGDLARLARAGHDLTRLGRRPPWRTARMIAARWRGRY